jgi:hypothetical protein
MAVELSLASPARDAVTMRGVKRTMSDGIGRDEQMDIKDRGRTRRASGQVRGTDAFEAEIDSMSAVTVASQRSYVCEGAEMQCIHRSQAVYISPLYGLTSKGKPVPLLSNSPATYGLVLNLPPSATPPAVPLTGSTCKYSSRAPGRIQSRGSARRVSS